jgi:hypothetical protein
MSGLSPLDEAKVDDAALAHLGEVLRPVAEHCGLATAMAIVAAHGGKIIYVPAHPRPGQKLVEAAGMEAAQVMAAAFGSEQVAIPSAALLRREGIKAAVARDNRPHGVRETPSGQTGVHGNCMCSSHSSLSRPDNSLGFVIALLNSALLKKGHTEKSPASVNFNHRIR